MLVHILGVSTVPRSAFCCERLGTQSIFELDTSHFERQERCSPLGTFRSPSVSHGNCARFTYLHLQDFYYLYHESGVRQPAQKVLLAFTI